MATINKRKTGSGEVVWELTHGTGDDRVRFVAGRTEEEAQVVLDQFKRQVALHGAAPKKLGIGNAVAEYGQYLKVNRRPRTTIRYMRVLRTFANCFLANFHPDLKVLREIRPSHVEEYKTRRFEGEIEERKTEEEVDREKALRASMISRTPNTTPQDNAKYGWLGRHGLRRKVVPRTVNYELRVLFTFFRWCIKHNYLFINPASQIERFRVPKRALPKFMTSEDLKRFFAACDERSQRLYGTILLTGMRKGEAEYLTWNDISLELGVVFIQEKPEYEWKPKTDERLIPISPMLNDILVSQYANRTSDVWVFANESGNRDTHMLGRLKRICKRAGVKNATVHALRHSFGAHLRMAGVDLADIGDLLGHKDLATTKVYAKVQQEHLRGVISKLTPLVANNKGQLPASGSPKHILETKEGIENNEKDNA
jgi:integrase/recombinase XerC